MTIIIVMMPPAKSYVLIYAPITKQHLRNIERRYHRLIRENIEEQLQFEPDNETRNRKPLKRPVVSGAHWEIRCGTNNRFRVFYRVDRKAHLVVILAIGEKKGEQLWIGGKEVES